MDEEENRESSNAIEDPRERQAIVAIRGGDASAYDYLVSKHMRQCLSIAWGITRNAADAEDLTQEAFVKAYEKVATFRTDQLFGPWMYRIVKRVLPRHGMRFVSEHVLRRLDRELDLTEQQRRQVKEILERRERSVERLWTGTQPLVRQEIDRANLEIERVLTPEQRPKYRKLVDRWRARARGFIGPPRRPQ